MVGRPSYLRLADSGELTGRASLARAGLRRCVLCPHACAVDRTRGEVGRCGIGALARVYSYGPHLGEEPPLVGYGGSGTIFFSGCNLSCVFCQNWDISQGRAGWDVAEDELAMIMLELQARGCHNVNLVSPSHVVPHILGALAVAVHQGLRIPLVYNTGGYDSLATVRLLAGIVDIYMPDAKYSVDEVAGRLSGADKYVQVSRAAILEMHRQVGDLALDERGLASGGLLVRHLVLPGSLAGTADLVRFLADQVSRDTYVNIMGQYRPEFQARRYPEIGRPVNHEEVREAKLLARRAGLHRGF